MVRKFYLIHSKVPIILKALITQLWHPILFKVIRYQECIAFKLSQARLIIMLSLK